MASFTFEREVAAPPELVFEVLVDHAGYAKSTPIRWSTIEREGDPAPNGVGAIRVLTAIGPAVREEVLAYDPPERFAYTMLSGAPVRDHVGTVSLTPHEGGTRVVYAVRTTPTLPLFGGLVLAVLKHAVGALLKGIAKESERRAAAGEP